MLRFHSQLVILEAETRQDRRMNMNTLSGGHLLNRSPVRTQFMRCLILKPQHLNRTSQFQIAHSKCLSRSSRRLCLLINVQPLRSATSLTCNLSRTGLFRQAPLSTSKVLWQDQQRSITADTKTTAVTVWEDLKQIRFSPVPALVLGFSGLIPFIAAPAYMIFSQAFYSQMVFAQTAYGACILSFLGGVRWGFVIPEESPCPGDWFHFGYSVTPSLVAWTALLLPQPVSILLVMGGIAGSAYFDTAFKGYPSWFKGLRFTLSFGAILSLWTAFLCQYMFGAPSDKEALKEDEKK
ncbi:transmembrane protein 69-like [Babylonia areolata]|uniref:transmembrane protein 69-like n=1 Tax=Babylonia areolata TaxID=304850 RepID=UPI003FCF8E1E